MGSTAVDGPGGHQPGETATGSISITADDGAVFRAEVYRCVNASTDPELADRLLDGSLYEVQAPDGQTVYELAFPIYYHDPDRGLFALIVPEALRHREFALRRALLDELEAYGELAAYMRDFQTVVGTAGLRRLLDEDPREAAERDELAADGGAPQAATQITTAPEPASSTQLDEARADVEREREALQKQRAEVEALEEKLADERAELEAEREALQRKSSEIEARELNLEQERLRAEHGGPRSNAEESTQVVTDDQFIEVVDQSDDDEAEEADDAQQVDEAQQAQAPSEATELIESPYLDEVGERPDRARVEPLAATQLPQGLDLDLDADARRVEVLEGRVVATAAVDSAQLQALEAGDELSFFVQYPDEGGYPVVGLLLAALDADQHSVGSVAWALDVAGAGHRRVLDHLRETVALEAVLVEEAGEVAAAFSVRAPLEENVGWIVARAQEVVDADEADASFEQSAHDYVDGLDGRLGDMKHNFHTGSFDEAKGPAEVKLACGIVAYWSAPERFEYLVSNRSFALDDFRALQQRVTRRAVQHGLCLPASLREVAIEAGLADDERQLVERLIVEFAELSVGLRENDLDPLQEWENWEGLIDLAEQCRVNLDAEVLELAQASLKRARDFQETDLPEAPRALELHEADMPVDPLDEFEVDDLVVARRSESTGVTYFLPDDAVLDTFDDLASMARDDLELLLADPKGRLEAAQMLIERFGAEGLQEALKATEQTTAAEVAALARFVETKAEGLEAELVRCLESSGPSATYVATRALVSIRSTSAIPTLLEAYRDGARGGNKRNLAGALAGYGDKLLPALKRTIKKEGHDDDLVVLLAELERQHDGLLAELAKDRSKKVRTAASEARSQ